MTPASETMSELIGGEDECCGAEETPGLELAAVETTKRRAWGQNPDTLFKFGLSFEALLKDDGNGGGGAAAAAALMGFESRGRGGVMKDYLVWFTEFEFYHSGESVSVGELKSRWDLEGMA